MSEQPRERAAQYQPFYTIYINSIQEFTALLCLLFCVFVLATVGVLFLVSTVVQAVGK